MFPMVDTPSMYVAFPSWASYCSNNQKRSAARRGQAMRYTKFCASILGVALVPLRSHKYPKVTNRAKLNNWNTNVSNFVTRR